MIFTSGKIKLKMYQHISYGSAGKKKRQMFTIESSHSSYNESYRIMASLLS